MACGGEVQVLDHVPTPLQMKDGSLWILHRAWCRRTRRTGQIPWFRQMISTLFSMRAERNATLDCGGKRQRHAALEGCTARPAAAPACAADAPRKSLPKGGVALTLATAVQGACLRAGLSLPATARRGWPGSQRPYPARRRRSCRRRACLPRHRCSSFRSWH